MKKVSQYGECSRCEAYGIHHIIEKIPFSSDYILSCDNCELFSSTSIPKDRFKKGVSPTPLKKGMPTINSFRAKREIKSRSKNFKTK